LLDQAEINTPTLSTKSIPLSIPRGFDLSISRLGTT